LVTGIDAVGAAMSSRLNAEGKPGYTMKSGSVYSTWWNGGLRTTAYYHNIIGLLTEIIGSPTPSKIPFVPNRLIPNSATPFPIEPKQWLFKNSIDYSVSLNYAVLNYAARYKDELLMNIYTMGKHAIEAGSKDHWTLSPKKVELVTDLYKEDKKEMKGDTIPVDYFEKIYRKPELRDARGYIVPINQPTTAITFINILINSGIRVEQAKADFTVSGKTYQAGSYIVKTNQAFRPHVVDMFEPQDHPNDFQYPGGPPVRPYDAAGWTPAFTMGIQFDRLIENFDGPFETIPYGQVQVAKGKIQVSSNVVAYSFSSKDNAGFILLNDLLKAGIPVTKDAEKLYVLNSAAVLPLLKKASEDYGLTITAENSLAKAVSVVSSKRIALWDAYGGSIPAGWVRWIFEQYHFSFSLIYVKEIDAASLKSKYDMIVFVGGAIPSVKAEAPNAWDDKEPKAEEIPAEFQPMLGKITAAKSIPALKEFLEAGGDIVTIGSSANLAYHLQLPVRNALVEVVNGKEKNLPGEKFYIPGSVMQIEIDNKQIANWGLGNKADVYFSASPVFKLLASSISNGDITPLAWYGSDKTLRSGWAFGQSYLQDGVAAFVAKVGKGHLFVYGPEISFRAQTHGSYKMLFNPLFTMKE